MNYLVSELVFNNEKAFSNINTEELNKIVQATSLTICIQNKNIKKTIKQQNQYKNVMNAFQKFEEDNATIIDLKSDEDNKLFNMLLIAEVKELMYETTHDFYFDNHDKLGNYMEVMKNRCTDEEIDSHLYDPNHFIFTNKKYYFYKIQKRGGRIF